MEGKKFNDRLISFRPTSAPSARVSFRIGRRWHDAPLLIRSRKRQSGEGRNRALPALAAAGRWSSARTPQNAAGLLLLFRPPGGASSR